jgi:dihydroflavonol-4-reductase
MRILVTGATGFIGARLLARLAVECDQLRILRRAASDTEPIKNIKYEEVVGDITNAGDVMCAVEGCDYVFHAAASVSYWDKLRTQQYDINVNGTKNVVAACLAHKVKRLIYTSSIVAIGMNKAGLADETTEYNLTPFNISYCDTKMLAEQEVQKGVAKGLDAVILNPGAVFGPGDTRRYRGQLYGGRVWTHKFYVGGGIATVDVDDVVDGHIRAWRHGKKGERYILANENLTFKEISSVIAKKMGWPVPGIRLPTWFIYGLAYLALFISKLTGAKPFATVPMAKFTRLNLFYSNKKAREELGVVFRPFAETNERAIEWYRDH